MNLRSYAEKDEEDLKGVYTSFIGKYSHKDYNPSDSDFDEVINRYKQVLVVELDDGIKGFVGHQTSEPEDFEVFLKNGVTEEELEKIFKKFNELFFNQTHLNNEDMNSYTLRVPAEDVQSFVSVLTNFSYSVREVNVDTSVEEMDVGRVAVVINKPVGLEFRADTYRLSDLSGLERDVKQKLDYLNDLDVEITFMAGTQTLVLNIPYKESMDEFYFASASTEFTGENFREGGERSKLVSDVKNVLSSYGIAEKRVEFNEMISGSLPFKTRETGKLTRPWD